LIYENIFKLRGNKTVIIVTHNINNLENCDSVYEFKDQILIKKK